MSSTANLPGMLGCASDQCSTVREAAAFPLTGAGACNGFGAIFGYEAHRGAVRIGNLLSTKRACFEPALNEADRMYFEALGAVSDASVDSAGRLVLSGSDAELVFEVGPQSLGPTVPEPPSTAPSEAP